MTPEPSRRLASAARWLWRAQGLGMTVAALIAAGVLSEQVGGAVWMLLPLVVAIVAIGVVPELRWARWRYEVRDDPGPRRGPRGPAARPHRRAGPHRR